jgi:hypothetical protein
VLPSARRCQRDDKGLPRTGTPDIQFRGVGKRKLGSTETRATTLSDRDTTALTANNNGTRTTRESTSVITVTVRLRGPFSRTWTLSSNGQVAMTSVVGHTAAGRKGRITRNEATSSPPMKRTARVACHFHGTHRTARARPGLGALTKVNAGSRLGARQHKLFESLRMTTNVTPLIYVSTGHLESG